MKSCPAGTNFSDPAVANIDQLVVIASGAIPVTDPFLIDRVVSIAEGRNCPAGHLHQQVRPGCGGGALPDLPRCRVPHPPGERRDRGGTGGALWGNCWKGFCLYRKFRCGQIQHTQRPGSPASASRWGRSPTSWAVAAILPAMWSCFGSAPAPIVADTPGFSSFDTEEIELRRPEELQYTFREFAPYLEQCRFTGCSHVKEKGCAVLAAVKAGEIAPSRHASYVRLYQQAKEVPEWERK